MPEIYLRQPRLTYSTGRPFTKNKKGIKNLKKHDFQNIFTKMN